MNKVYAFTDLHGEYNLWEQIRDYCDETDILYFLGDACDRGDDGMKIIKELLQDKRVIFLKGNHEQFFDEVGAEIIEGRCGNTHLWRMNGGHMTINDFSKLSEDSQLYYLNKIQHLPLKVTYQNKKGQIILLSHAGFTPGLEPTKIDEMLWDRDHIYDEWPQEEEYKDVFIVHGHTPIFHLATCLNLKVDLDEREIWEPITYADGHKIALDMGTALSGKAVLFDLDEMKVEKRFYDENILKGAVV